MTDRTSPVSDAQVDVGEQYNWSRALLACSTSAFQAAPRSERSSHRNLVGHQRPATVLQLSRRLGFSGEAILAGSDWLSGRPGCWKTVVLAKPGRQLRVEPAKNFDAIGVQVDQRWSQPQELLMMENAIAQIPDLVQGG